MYVYAVDTEVQHYYHRQAVPLPVPGGPEASPPPSPSEDDDGLGLFDGPGHYDAFRLALEEIAGDASDEEDALALNDQHATPPQSPRLLQQVDGRGSRTPSPDNAAEAAPRVEIPDVSELDHPALAHALDLPALPPSLSPRVVFERSHPLWYVRVILLLVAYLHTHHHVTFRASDLTLSMLRAIFVALGMLDSRDPMPRTLTTTFKRLDLTDKFHILIECSSCRRLFRPDIANKKLHCFVCNTPLFTTPSCALALLIRVLRMDAPIPIPRTIAPLCLLSSAIAYLMNQPGIETYWEAWTTRPAPPPGEYRSIHDGSRWKILVGPDGKPFFGPDINGELRVPVILHVDWFSAASSVFSASYSTGAISFSLPTLPPALRYRVEYLILAAMTDGPKEPDAEELQHWMALIVDDLLMLYHLGVFAPTPSCREGRRCCVVVICACTDHPAMCKVGGFADKNHHEVPCTEGTVTAEDMYTDKCLRGGCPPRSHEEHVQHAREWRALAGKERDEHFKEHGSRWAEIMRLPYYDCVKMTVINLMHNLLLGVVKTQWYSRWIKPNVLRADTKGGTKRELAMMHAFLDTFEVPGWVGRLPLRVGEPAGGSLSADEYKHLMIGPGCIILPIIWHHFAPEIKKEHAAALKKHARLQQAYKKAVDKHTADIAELEAKIDSASDAQEPKLSKRLASLKANRPEPLAPCPKPRMCAEEVRLILQLSTSLKLLLAPVMTARDRERGSTLLYDYLVGYKEIYGVEAMVPNHHFASHIPAQLDEFATVYEIWAFLAERLNKTLKATNLNNRRGGQQEVVMMRAFQRDIALRAVVEHVASTPSAETTEARATRTIAQRFQHNTRESQGTLEVAAAMQGDELDVQNDALLSVSMHAGPRSAHPQTLDDAFRAYILGFYNHPNAAAMRNADGTPPQIYYRHDRHAPRKAVFLDTSAHTHWVQDPGSRRSSN
ncbi:uncharacterized protein TRAVEDRAFT_52738 [Trametes versicolor FP-101664 SS1]|uniref:uncharacterized protein n=1 Tax=Trametes versicolor (strain FP-101664) TaxID=717944 RepID=UPI0004622264|nr:uncharacterized protein TRAVEDRAFT_52738 [Trametes versicolor FP-101664 SS1]EIW53620.1 hypothetical protein TRAVEDRAFT_52738 [Trametes versicolor FP-101664 SS1]